MSTAFDPRHRLRPPFRGDWLAGSLLILAVLLFAGSTWAFWATGLIVWSDVGPLLRFISGASLALTLGGFTWSILKDWRWLHTEERDIHLVLETPEGRTDPTRVLHSNHDTAAERRVETLLDDRVTRLLAPIGDGRAAPVRESELRAVAMWRSAGIGSFARYTSGLLLLFTVLGTFVGVKSSLGPLTQSLQSVANAGATDAAGLANSLQDVASAFGSNLVALIGAIALGLAAYALSAGRQNMLARLEQASSLYVYPRVQQATVSDEFTKALKRMSASNKQLGSITEQLGRLGDSIDDLSTTVSDSLGATRASLQTLLEQQAGQVAEQAKQSVDKVERQITDVVAAVQHATALYGTLVTSFEEGRNELGGTSQALAVAVTELQKAREDFGKYADSATRALDARLATFGQSIERVESAFDRQARIARHTYRRYRSIDAGVGRLASRSEELARAWGEAERQRREAQAAIERQALEEVARQVGAPVGELQQAVTALATSLGGLPEKTGKAVEAALTPAMQRAVNEAVTSAITALPPPPPSLAPPAPPLPPPVPDIGPTLDRLAQILSGMEQQMARPLWQRVLGRDGSNGRRRAK